MRPPGFNDLMMEILKILEIIIVINMKHLNNNYNNNEIIFINSKPFLACLKLFLFSKHTKVSLCMLTNGIK